MEASVSSNQAKYETGNPVVQRLLARFFAELRSVVAPLAPESVLDAGCGEGEAIARLAEAPAGAGGGRRSRAELRRAGA